MTVTDTPTRLLKASARRSYDPEVDIDWSAVPDDERWWMQPERTSLYGTDLWDGLTPQQQRELVKHETASIVHMGWWFEVILMQGLLREVYTGDPRSARTQFLLTEVGDECRHSTMFGRAMETAGAPSYGPPPVVRRLAQRAGWVLKGPSLYAGALLVEETLDRWQRDSMTDERLQPLTRMVNRIHVTEEARHIKFAREGVVHRMQDASWLERFLVRNLNGLGGPVLRRSLTHRGIYHRAGLDVDRAYREAQASSHHREMAAVGFASLAAFLEENGLMGRIGRELWRRNGFLP